MLIKAIGIILFFVISFFIVYELSKEGDKRPILDIKKTMCFGTCPVYSATIYDDGTVSYDGEMYVDKKGHDKFKLSTGQTSSLKSMINALNVNDLKDEYDGNITDLPSTLLTFYLPNQNNQVKKIRARYNTPEKLDAFIDMVHKMIMQKTQMSIKTEKTEKTDF